MMLHYFFAEKCLMIDHISLHARQHCLLIGWISLNSKQKLQSVRKESVKCIIPSLGKHLGASSEVFGPILYLCLKFI